MGYHRASSRYTVKLDVLERESQYDVGHRAEQSGQTVELVLYKS